MATLVLRIFKYILSIYICYILFLSFISYNLLDYILSSDPISDPLHRYILGSTFSISCPYSEAETYILALALTYINRL